MSDLPIPDFFVSPLETQRGRRIALEGSLILDVPRPAPLCDNLPGLRPQRVDLGGVRLYVEHQGAGTPVVLLHGGPGASHHSFHPSFSRMGDDVHLIYYDQRGCFRSDYQPGPGYSVAQSVADLEALRRELGLDRWVLLGHSYGGFLAQCYAVTHPDRVLGLILVTAAITTQVTLDPSPYADFLFPEERPVQDAIFGNPQLTPAQLMFNSQVNGRWIRQHYYRPTRDTLARIAHYEWTHDAGYYDAIVTSMPAWDLRGAFDGGTIPTLLMEGNADLTWNTDKPGKLQALHPHAEMIRFERAGHLPFNDEPDRFFGAVRSFLGRLTEPA